MNRIAALLLLLTSCAGIAAQDIEAPDETKANLDWAVGLGGRFRRFHDPVVVAYSLAQLGSLVCPQNRGAGAELFRDSLFDLRALTPQAFTSARHRLPVPSFTTLWNLVTPAAAKCAPELRDSFDTERAKAKMQEERQQANDDVRDAFSAVDAEPDRAAQLVETALSVSDPTLLDIPSVTLLLSQLRDRAAEVSDDLFPKVLDFIASAQQPSPSLLLELGKYLFTAPRYLYAADVQQLSDVHQVGSTSIATFTANRRTASSDDIHDYIDAALKVVTATNDTNYDPVAAYAIAYQLVPKVDDYAPELADRLRQALTLVTQQAGSSATQVQEAVTGAEMPDPDGSEAVRNRNRWVREVFSRVTARRFPEARELVMKIDDSAAAGQVRTLIDFAEASAAMERNDVQLAITIANSLRGGLKRAMLYAGATSASRNNGESLGYFGLGIHDTTLLPAEQRMVTTAALLGAIQPKDEETTLLALRLFVQAANDAYAKPHQGRFDPQVLRKIYSGSATSFTDSSLILANSRCLCEVVDTGRGRHTFALQIPGLPGYDLPNVIRNAKAISGERVEGHLVELHDETLQSTALTALAAYRLARGGAGVTAEPRQEAR
jgi:hypothetical protein